YYGTLRAGLIAVPVNFRFPRQTIHFIIRDSGTKVVFCDRARRADCPDWLSVVCFGDDEAESFERFLDTGPFDAIVPRAAVPAMIAMMLREKELLARTDLSSVEFVRMGSAPVSASLMEALRQALPRAVVANAYGTTEAGPVVFGPHPKGLPQPELSVGYPHPKVTLRLVDEIGRAHV